MSGRILDTAPMPYPLGKGAMSVEYFASGDAPVNTTLDNAAAVDQGSGLVRIPSTGHGFDAGSMIAIRGSTNYDGIYVLAAAAADTFDVYATYVAETFAGTETARPEIWINQPWQLLDWSVHLSAAGGAAEAFAMNWDSGLGAAWDVPLHSTDDMTLITDIHESWGQYKIQIGKASDAIYFTYANTNSRTWGLRARVLTWNI